MPPHVLPSGKGVIDLALVRNWINVIRIIGFYAACCRENISLKCIGVLPKIVQQSDETTSKRQTCLGCEAFGQRRYLAQMGLQRLDCKGRGTLLAANMGNMYIPRIAHNHA